MIIDICFFEKVQFREH